jgi:hypothetical protein
MPDSDSELVQKPATPPIFTESVSAASTRLDTSAGVISEEAGQLAKLRVREIEGRIKARKNYARGFFGLLIAQNVGLASFIGAEAGGGHLASLAPLVIGIGSATLVETAAIVQIVVRWMFAEIDYSEKPAKPRRRT